jgi:hypothetical protein
MARRQQISVPRITLALAALVILLTAFISAEVVLVADNDKANPAQLDLDNRFLITKTLIPVAPAMTSFEEVTRRTLFAPDRGRSSSAPSPSEAKTEVPQQPTSDPQMTLMAVIMAPGMRLAILQPVAGGAAQRVPLGETVGEWRLTAIYPDHVELVNSEKTEKLYLSDSMPLEGTSGGKNENQEAPDSEQ